MKYSLPGPGCKSSLPTKKKKIQNEKKKFPRSLSARGQLWIRLRASVKKGATLAIRAADFLNCNGCKSLLLVRCIEISLKFINHSCTLLQEEQKEGVEEEEEEDKKGKDTGVVLEGIAVLCQCDSDRAAGRVKYLGVACGCVCVCVKKRQFCVSEAGSETLPV